jgi:phage tail sheath protein FI
MPRLNYSAPGVYVEEIPSARQPIAGVGTNTVGFIGIVPDTIYCPVANPDYDPVTARAVLTLASPADASPEAAAAAKKEIEARQSALAAEATALQGALTKAQGDVKDRTKDRDDAKAEQTAAADDAAKTAAERKLRRAETLLKTATDAQAKAEDDIKRNAAESETLRATMADKTGAAAAAAGAATETEDLEYTDTKPGDALLQPSLLRPYYFVPFVIKAEEFATKLCTNFSEYTDKFGDFSGFAPGPVNPDAPPGAWRFSPLHPGHHLLTHAVSGFFRNGGTRAFVARVKSEADLDKALQRFESIDEVAILAAPGLPKTPNVWGQLQDYCEDDSHQNVFAILDTPGIVGDGDFDIQKLQYDSTDHLLPRMSTHAAFYFPFIEVNDPAKRLQDEDPARGVPPKYRGLTHVAPSGHMAGVYARIDEERGVHKAPANAVVRGALEVKYYVSKAKQELLNPQGVNCIRIMNGTVVVWGARTMGGDRNGEWKYINVRRFAGFLEESIDEGTQWVVFEPNDPTLWSKIRLNVSAFLTNVWRNGALFGQTPEEAFYVKCDAELNPPEVRDLGQVITEIGVAIVRPAEFVIFRIAQSTGAQKA